MAAAKGGKKGGAASGVGRLQKAGKPVKGGKK